MASVEVGSDFIDDCEKVPLDSGGKADGHIGNGDVCTRKATEAGEDVEEWKEEVEGLQYRIDENPPFYLCVMLGFQHYISMFTGTLTVPFLLSPAICLGEDNVGKSELIGTLFVASGIITLLQTIIGCRLPVVQAGTFALLAPTLAYLSLPQWECPSNIITPDEAEKFMNNASFVNETYIVVGSSEHKDIWMLRLREIQGAIMCAALLEVVLGATGAVGFMLRFIGPLAICPTISLLGLSLFKSAATFAEKQWWICALVLLLMVIFSQYMGKIQIPCVAYNKEKGVHAQGYPLLKMFPVILSIGLAWLICFILTVTNVFPEDKDKWGYHARTDLRTDVLEDSPWFRFPYPGQWGMPTVSIAAVVALLSGILATTIESIGDYHAYARLSGAPPPPLHAVNRGILVEGLGSFLDGMFGTGNGTTSTSINVGVVGITKVGSRRVVQYSAFFMIAFGVFTKFGAFFVTIPDPVIGGTFMILFGVIVAVGISNLQYVDMNSSRNLFIIGFSLFMGLCLPQWVATHKGAISTGNQVTDNIFQVLLSTSMFVGGLTGFLLDNTIPGTDEERGLAHWKNMRSMLSKANKCPKLTQRLAASYDLPFGMEALRRWRWTRYVPFLPTYGMSDLGPEDLDVSPENKMEMNGILHAPVDL